MYKKVAKLMHENKGESWRKGSAVKSDVTAKYLTDGKKSSSFYIISS